MLVLITYDVDTISETGASRLRKVARECLNYGQRVQNSVFECILTEAQFVLLKNNLKTIIDNDLDSVRFYFLGNNWVRKVDLIGKQTSLDMNSTFII